MWVLLMSDSPGSASDRVESTSCAKYSQNKPDSSGTSPAMTRSVRTDFETRPCVSAGFAKEVEHITDLFDQPWFARGINRGGSPRLASILPMRDAPLRGMRRS